MSAKILDGKILAKRLIESLKIEVEVLRRKTGNVPHLVNIMVGEDYGSCAYANSQKRTAQEIGIDYELRALPEKISQNEFVEAIRRLNLDPSVNGIMIHKPLPKHLNYAQAADCLDIGKDLEGINVANIGKMLLGQTQMLPCTPASVMEHIKSTGIILRGKETVIVGASNIVGKPLSLLLLRELATVTVCHIGTSEAGRLREHVERAEILIVAVGKAGLIKGEWIREKAIVIDVGINKEDGKVVGDVEFEKAKERASYITPVPGGVGPVTVVGLMRNGIVAYKTQHNT